METVLLRTLVANQTPQCVLRIDLVEAEDMGFHVPVADLAPGEGPVVGVFICCRLLLGEKQAVGIQPLQEGSQRFPAAQPHHIRKLPLSPFPKAGLRCQ